MESGGGYESPEKRIVSLEVMPVFEVQVEPAERAIVPNLNNVVESVQDDSREENHIIVNQLLGEGLDGENWDDSGLRQLIENAPVGL